MNKHLEPVFNVLLLGLEKAEIDYWVYGGISIAALVGKFIRTNKDVDIFVKETDYQKVKSILEDLCSKNNYSPISCTPLKKTKRPKLDIKINKEERLSVVSIYLKNNSVEFRFWKGPEKYPHEILEKVKRNISGYRFFTPQNEYIKKLFINYLRSRRDKINKEKLQIDARAILTKNERSKIFKKDSV